jgi:hypothetical protein
MEIRSVVVYERELIELGRRFTVAEDCGCQSQCSDERCAMRGDTSKQKAKTSV